MELQVIDFQMAILATISGHQDSIREAQLRRRDIHGATAAYYARHAGITGEFLMRHEGKTTTDTQDLFVFNWVLVGVVVRIPKCIKPLRTLTSNKKIRCKVGVGKKDCFLFGIVQPGRCCGT